MLLLHYLAYYLRVIFDVKICPHSSFIFIFSLFSLFFPLFKTLAYWHRRPLQNSPHLNNSFMSILLPDCLTGLILFSLEFDTEYARSVVQRLAMWLA